MGELMGIPPGMANWLRARKVARGRATDSSFGSGSRFGWTSITNAELTTENKSSD